MPETAERLVDFAEAHIRNAGSEGFSLHGIAEGMSIGNASVRRYFPTQATRAAIVARPAGRRFLRAVAKRPDETAEGVITAYRSASRDALNRDGRMCLCGVLGAEAVVRSLEVGAEILSLFQRCTEDLSQWIGAEDAETRAFHIMATFEGGMMFSRAYKDIEVFDQAVAHLM
jgi:TetR/AcrR family transcriptional repressor of nem operon